MPNNILITPGSASIQFSGSAANTIRLQVEQSGSVAFYGNSGSLFGITDQLSGSLMSVNDISGVPILEVFSDDRVVMGTFGRNTLVVSGSTVTVSGSLLLSGSSNISGGGSGAGFPYSGSAVITGSLLISGSSTSSIFQVIKSGSRIVNIAGSQGELFSIDDSLSGSLMSVNDVTGLPILEVFSDDRVVMGTFGRNTLVVSGSTVTVSGSLLLSGSSNIGGGSGAGFPYSGSAVITGSLLISSSLPVELQVVGDTRMTGSLIISGSSTSSIFDVYKSGSRVINIEGSQGQLFSVTDSLSGSLMSVNDITGIPILEVFSDDRVVMGTFGRSALVVSGSIARITGSLSGSATTAVSASFANSAISASFASNTTSASFASSIGTLTNGIQFPAVQVESSNVNNLDDYEEGTWTATLKGNPSDPTTPVTSTGYYTKIGRVVTFTANFVGVNTTGASGTVTVAGLPFSCSVPHTVLYMAEGFTFPVSGSYPFGLTNLTSVELYVAGNNVSPVALQHDAGIGRVLRVTGTYQSFLT